MRSGAPNGDGAAASQQFQLLVASIKDYAIFMLDASGRITTWNIGAQRIKGYLREEALGRHIALFHTPEDVARGKPQALLDAALADGRVEDEGWRVRKDGTRFWAGVIITAVRTEEGRLIGFAKITRDLTKQKEVEDKLRQSEASLSATLYSIGDGVLAADEHGRVTRINPVAERLTGWTEQQALGRPIEDVFHILHEHTRAKAPNPVARVLEAGVVIGLANHTALVSRDGTERPIADSAAPIRDAQGGTRGAVLVFRDVSEERRAEEALRQSEERLRLMIASVADYAIYMLDPEGRVATWELGAERMMGYRSGEILGAHFSRFFAPEDVLEGKPARELELAAEQGRFEEESWRVRKDGSRFWANIVITPMRDQSQKLVGFVKVARDLTDRERLQQERLTFARAEEAVRLRDEFLSIASHELKTPLTALQLQLQVVRDRLAPTDTSVAHKIDRAMHIGGRLAQLVETLLDVSRIATGRMALELEAFDLGELVGEVVDRLRDAAARAACVLVLTTDGPLSGRWDRLRIEQVLMNLLSNAIKYGARHPVSVSVSRKDGAALVVVEDRGPGIPGRELERIFERFARAASTRHYGGMGLGLYVARQIVEAHGGTITASNLPDGGAGFTVRLPL